jgi:hypothetical protein
VLSLKSEIYRLATTGTLESKRETIHVVVVPSCLSMLGGLLINAALVELQFCPTVGVGPAIRTPAAAALQAFPSDKSKSTSPSLCR